MGSSSAVDIFATRLSAQPLSSMASCYSPNIVEGKFSEVRVAPAQHREREGALEVRGHRQENSPRPKVPRRQTGSREARGAVLTTWRTHTAPGPFNSPCTRGASRPPLRLLLGATDEATSPGHGDVRIGLVRTSEQGTPRRLRPWGVGNRPQELQQLPSRGAVLDCRRETITHVQHQVGVRFA